MEKYYFEKSDYGTYQISDFGLTASSCGPKGSTRDLRKTQDQQTGEHAACKVVVVAEGEEEMVYSRRRMSRGEALM